MPLLDAFKAEQQPLAFVLPRNGVGPVAMEYAQVEVLLGRQMPHTGDERLPQRPSSAYFAKTLSTVV
jgi:hypothetical protein